MQAAARRSTWPSRRSRKITARGHHAAGSDAPVENVPVISTGAISLDAALGIGGIPRGRVTEIFGPESSGKTTLALHIIAEAQRTGGIAGFVDAEHALDLSYARKLGIATEDS